MISLIKLELKKTNMKPYRIACISIFWGILFFCFFFGFMPIVLEKTGTLISQGVDISMISDWNFFILIISILTMLCFSLLSSVLYSKFIITEYRGKSLILLFSYPQKRSHILWAKFLLCFCFTIFFAFLCNLAALFIFITAASFFPIFPTSFSSSNLFYLISVSITSALLSGGIGIISLRIGFWKSSVPAALISAFLCCCICSNLFTLKNSSLFLMAGMTAAFLGISLLIFFNLTKFVNHMEVA